MNPKYLRLSGFLSYNEPVELDFSVFELACISGANGAGKSSLLDAITWALFGQARRRDDALINSHAKAAEVVFDFFYEDILYRIQRTKPRDKTTLLEFYMDDRHSGWKVLTESTLRETELSIQRMLRLDYETFINASFFLQGRADQFAQQRPADRKRILSSVLGLEVWETYRERAADRRKQLETGLATLSGQLDEIETELKLEEPRRARLKQLEEDLVQASAMRKIQDGLLENLRRLSASLDEQRNLVAVLANQEQAARQRLTESIDQLGKRQDESEGIRQQIAQADEIETAYHAWLSARKELEKWDQLVVNFRQFETKRMAPLMKIDAERSRLDQERSGLLSQQLQVQELVSALPTLTDQLVSIQHSVGEAAQRLEGQGILEAGLAALVEKRADAKAANERLKPEMNELKERIDRLKLANGADCPICGQPLSPQDRLRLIGDLEAQGREKGDLYRSNLEILRLGEQQRADLEGQLDGLRKVETTMREQQRKLDQLGDRKTQIENTLAAWRSGGALRLAEVELILDNSGYATQAREELAQIDAALRELGYDAGAHDAARKSELAGRSSENLLRQLDADRARLEPLEREISNLERQAARDQSELKKQADQYLAARTKLDGELSQLPDLKQAEDHKFSLQEKENSLRTEVGGAVQNVEVLKTLRLRQKDFNLEKEGLRRQVVQLKSLERAFSKDGVPALLIEQSLPEIEAQANEILDRLTGGNMSVRFDTQKAYKDKNRDEKKETLDILISDPVGTREYEMFSGGEAFRVNFAIRLALSRVLAQRAGARLQLLVIDEGFGSQDAEGRQRLVEAINLVQNDFARVLVITHLEELKDAFPARIEVEKTATGSRLQVVA